MADVNTVLQALHEKSHFDVVDHSVGPNQLRVIGRIPADQMGQFIQNWLIIARNLLLAQEKGSPWKVDISKQYFLKGPEGQKKIVYGHRLIIEATNIEAHYPAIVAAILDSKPAATVEVTSFPLPGATAERNTGKNGKGANSLGGR